MVFEGFLRTTNRVNEKIHKFVLKSSMPFREPSQVELRNNQSNQEARVILSQTAVVFPSRQRSIKDTFVGRTKFSE